MCSKVTGVDRKELEDKYQHLNIGMQGMSLANRTRGALNKDAKLEAPTGLLEKMNKLVAPIHKENGEKSAVAAKVKADKDAKAKAEKLEATKVQAAKDATATKAA